VKQAVERNELALGELYDRWRMNDLDGLRVRLADVDLEPEVADWRAWLTDQVHPTTADRYLAHVRTLLPAGQPYPRSAFTAPALAGWLANRRALVAKRKSSAKRSRRVEDSPARVLSGSSKRKYLAAVQSFARYLRELGMINHNPARELNHAAGRPPRAASSWSSRTCCASCKAPSRPLERSSLLTTVPG
jgi:hypothetical protein